MSHYKHLTLLEREKIMYFLAKWYSVSSIALKLGRNKSTISRELKRNSSAEYSPILSQIKYAKRRKHFKPHKPLQNQKLYNLVLDKFLNHQWSPEQISGRLKAENSNISISYSTIYRAIYRGMFDTKEQRTSKGNKGAIRKLWHRGKASHTKDYVECYGKIQISNPISERPKKAENRSRPRDWEADTVAG